MMEVRSGSADRAAAKSARSFLPFTAKERATLTAKNLAHNAGGFSKLSLRYRYISSQDSMAATGTSFTDLPPEIRNYIYELAGCAVVHQCRVCTRMRRGDDVAETQRYNWRRS